MMTPLWWRLLTILPVDFPVLKTNMIGRSTNYVFTKMLRDVKQPKRENTASFFPIKPSSFAPWLLLSNPASHKTVESDVAWGRPVKLPNSCPWLSMLPWRLRSGTSQASSRLAAVQASNITPVQASVEVLFSGRCAVQGILFGWTQRVLLEA